MDKYQYVFLSKKCIIHSLKPFHHGCQYIDSAVLEIETVFQDQLSSYSASRSHGHSLSSFRDKDRFMWEHTAEDPSLNPSAVQLLPGKFL
jgi:hypothetical protein